MNEEAFRQLACVRGYGDFRAKDDVAHRKRAMTASLEGWTPPDRKPMCQNIRTLFNFEPPAAEGESGFAAPSEANEAAFELAVEEVAASARKLIGSLVTTADPRNREVEAQAKPRSAARFGVAQ